LNEWWIWGVVLVILAITLWAVVEWWYGQVRRCWMQVWALYEWVIRGMVLDMEVTGLLLEVVRGEV
jgi:hypothetical protein